MVLARGRCVMKGGVLCQGCVVKECVMTGRHVMTGACHNRGCVMTVDVLYKNVL